jgi:cytochrome c biogenesis protein CcdA/thiol-disulfide isomerase/thioredoxin
MILLLAFAFVSGVITILSPCILPVLPIVLSGSLGKGRAKPFGVIAGFVASFTLFTLALSAIVQALGIPADAMRYVAVALIVVFGVVMLVPKLNGLFEIGAARIAAIGQGANKPKAGFRGVVSAGNTAGAATASGGSAPSGFWSGLLVGFSLGLIWTPCVGPIMASVISLSLTKRIDSGSVLITLAYTIGTSLPMLAVMFGGRTLLKRVPSLSRNAGGIQRGFGVLMIVLGITIGLGFDRSIQAAILTAFPSYGTGLTAIEQAAPVEAALKARGGAGKPATAAGRFSGAPDGIKDNGRLSDYGAAPDFVAAGPWFNTPGSAAGSAPPSPSPGLSLADLRGKVVLVDFWTYSCVNCVRTLPYLRAWYDAYKDKGLVIVGVHTPEFEFEKVSSNVSRAMGGLGVTWPVVQDNDYAQWNAYGNRYWPAHYFIDAKGRVRYVHFGEGGYEVSEGVIRALLKEAGKDPGGAVSRKAPEIDSRTPETYLGYERGRNLASSVAPKADQVVEYRPARVPGNGEWNLEGRWTIAGQYVVPESAGTLSLGFNAKDVFLVVEPEGKGGSIGVSVDGVPVGDGVDVRDGTVRPTESRLYHLVKLPASGSHVLTLVVSGKLRLFAFTFG